MDKVTIEFYNLIDGLFKDNQIQITKIVKDNKLYYNGIELLNHLEYSNVDKNSSRTFEKLDPEYKIRLSDLYDGFPIPKEDPNSGYVNSLDGNQRKSLLITEQGMFQLLLDSNKPKAVEFKRFLVNKLFPIIKNQDIDYLQSMFDLEEKINRLVNETFEIKEDNRSFRDRTLCLFDMLDEQETKLDFITNEFIETKTILDEASEELKRLTDH